MKYDAVKQWNTMGLIQMFKDDLPPPDEGRNFYKLLVSDDLKDQFNEWGGSDDHAEIWSEYLCNAMSVGALAYPPQLLFLFTKPVEIPRMPSVEDTAGRSVALYKHTPFLLAGEQPAHRDAVLFDSWDSFWITCKYSVLFGPLWEWAFDNLSKNSWWVVTIDPSMIVPGREKDGKLWENQ